MLGYARPQPASICAAKPHVRPHLAPSGDGPHVPSKQRVAGSNPARRTQDQTLPLAGRPIVTRTACQTGPRRDRAAVPDLCQMPCCGAGAYGLWPARRGPGHPECQRSCVAVHQSSAGKSWRLWCCCGPSAPSASVRSRPRLRSGCSLCAEDRGSARRTARPPRAREATRGGGSCFGAAACPRDW